jgi:hypothetical protein
MFHTVVAHVRNRRICLYHVAKFLEKCACALFNQALMRYMLLVLAHLNLQDRFFCFQPHFTSREPKKGRSGAISDAPPPEATNTARPVSPDGLTSLSLDGSRKPAGVCADPGFILSLDRSGRIHRLLIMEPWRAGGDRPNLPGPPGRPTGAPRAAPAGQNEPNRAWRCPAQPNDRSPTRAGGPHGPPGTTSQYWSTTSMNARTRSSASDAESTTMSRAFI